MQRDIIDSNAIYGFFQSDIGRKLIETDNVLREFKFSVLDDGLRYQESLNGEKVLLQGVVDCVLVEEDGLTIIDFKTDHVTEDTLASVTNAYTQQIQVYAHAMSRIYKLPVKKTALYYFHLKQFVYV